MHIRAFMKDIAPRAAVVLGMLLMCSASAQEPARAPWWDADWARRFVVRTVPQGRRGGLNVARFNLGEQSDLCQPDGRDVRVVTPDGQPVPCEVRLRNNRTLDVLFAVREADTYFLYYSNPDAEEPALEWPERRTGGLTLETRSLSRPVRAPENLEARWEDAGESFGSRSWGRVYDLENPFGRDDFYISRYEGTLYCPQDGSYLFSINADDCAALWLGDRQQPLCVRSPGTPSSSWQDPRHPEATVRTELEEGIYRIRYYHAERFGSQLAALGWKEPTSELIETIPQDAYATYLPSSVEARQSRDGKPTPYFVADHRYNLAVRGVEHQFPHYWFEVRWPAAPKADDGQEWTYHWDFGDGSTATGRGVDHEFGSLETRRVTLTAVRGNERRSITRPLSPPARPVRHMRLDMRVRPESRVIDPEDGVKLQVLLRNDSQFRRRVTLRSRGPRGTENESPTARTPSRRREITLPGGQPGLWSALSWEFPVRSRNSLVDIELRLHDHTVASTTVSMLHTDAPLGQLNYGPGGELRDGRGRQVVLVRQAVDGDALPTRRLSTGGSSTVRMVVVETGSGLPAAGDRHEGIVEFFQRCMARRYPTLEFNMVRR
ncbi:MAG: PKD domain-containing protein, partial [Planctomycetota bacterium]